MNMKSGLTDINYLKERLPEATIEWYRNKFVPSNGFTILNVNGNENDIGHWVLIYKNNYLDPFGLYPSDDIAKKLFNKFGGFHLNTFKIQYKNSENCGNYCLYFADLIKKGHSVNEIIEAC